jgi:hypothetical protein
VSVGHSASGDKEIRSFESANTIFVVDPDFDVLTGMALDGLDGCLSSA